MAAIERMTIPAHAQVEALRVENFSTEGPKLPAEKRAEWQALFYARGIGQVAEADGLGGECALSKIHLVRAALSARDRCAQASPRRESLKEEGRGRAYPETSSLTLLTVYPILSH